MLGVHIWNCVAKTTRQTNSVGWNRWREFVFDINTDIGLTVIPPELVGNLEGLGWTEACFMAFLSYLRDGSGSHGTAFCVRPLTADVPFCLATEMFVLNADARPLADHPFMSYRGQWSYDVSHLNAAIKWTVAKCDLDPRRFDSVSLRIAGACILAAADVPDYLIRKAGRWKSDVFLRYIPLLLPGGHA